MTHVAIIGCGDIGFRVAQLEQQNSRHVVGLVRSPPCVTRLEAHGMQALQGDLDHPDQLPTLPSQALVYYFAPPPPQGTVDRRMENFLQTLKQPPRKIIYISTTGVYGDCKGAWVDETTTPTPGNDRAKRRLDAEKRLLAYQQKSGTPVVILRVGGIYGPGRLPLERIRQGAPVLCDEDSHSFTNRIHADDLARICIAAADKGEAGAIYNVSDGQPGTMAQYFNTVAHVFGLPAPPAIGLREARQRFSAEMLSYLDESRRIDNRKMLHDLGITLQYPNLEAGLAACLTHAIDHESIKH